MYLFQFYTIIRYLFFKKKNNLTKKKIILFIGRIDKIKGVDLLVNAFIDIHKQFEKHQLVICGFDGGILDNLKKLVKAGADIIVIDTAHGHTKNVLET